MNSGSTCESFTSVRWKKENSRNKNSWKKIYTKRLNRTKESQLRKIRPTFKTSNEYSIETNKQSKTRL